MKTRELSLATFILAAFGASLAACGAEGTTATPDNVSFAGSLNSAAGAAVIPPAGSTGTPLATAGASSSPGGAPGSAGGAPAAAGAGVTFGGAPSAGGAAGAPPTGGCAAAVGVAAMDLSIDDFEDGNGAIEAIGSRKGFWYTFNDGTATQVPTSSATVPFKPVAGGHSAMFSAETSGPAFTTWGAGIGFDFNKAGDSACVYNAAAYTGITFWAKSTAPFKAMVQIPATTAKQTTADSATCASATMCNDHYYIAVPASAAWTQYTIAFADRTAFKQEGWGVPATWNASALLGMQFQVGKALAFDFAIDDVAFY